MKRRLLVVASIVALSTLPACDRHEGKGHHADIDEVAGAIRAQEAQWNRHYASRDAAGLASMYAADAALASPGTALLSGAAIGPALRQYAADPNLQLQFEADRIQVAQSGELAYSRGHFTMRSTDPATGQPRNDQGSYLTVWQRQPDRSWKAVEDFITPGPPIAPGAGPTADTPSPGPAG